MARSLTQRPTPTKMPTPSRKSTGGGGPTFSVGDRVFAKVKGFPHWPARVEAELKANKYKVSSEGYWEILDKVMQLGG